jgi:hypothetical protein
MMMTSNEYCEIVEEIVEVELESAFLDKNYMETVTKKLNTLFTNDQHKKFYVKIIKSVKKIDDYIDTNNKCKIVLLCELFVFKPEKNKIYKCVKINIDVKNKNTVYKIDDLKICVSGIFEKETYSNIKILQIKNFRNDIIALGVNMSDTTSNI